MDGKENTIKRIKPQSIEAEQTVIGAMILDNECIPAMESMLTGSDFYQRQYGVIFDAIVELYNEGKPVDLLTLQDRLKEKNVPPEVSNLEYIGDLIAAVPITANAKYYAEIVSEKAILRRMIDVNESVANNCYAGKDRVDAILEDAEKQFFNVLSRNRSLDYTPVSEIVSASLEKISQAALSKNPITGLPTGFRDLDEMLTGLHPAELILIAARPSMGKTALVLNFIQNISFKQDECVAFFSLEMSKEMIMNRLLSQQGTVDAQRMRTGDLSDAEWDKLLEAAEVIGRSNLIIDDTPGISVAEVRSKCRKIKLEKNLKLVVIDYLQLMSASGRRGNDNRQQEITEISRALKALARDIDAPVVALSQLSRSPEQRADHRPMLSDLRESGSIEQDADVVMFIYRDDYYDKESPAKGITELIIAKQRNGPVGKVELVWLPQYTKFGNLERGSGYQRPE